MRGYLVIINTQQFYNPDSRKIVKVYSLKHGGEEVLRSSSTIKLVKYLAAVNKELNKDSWLMELSEHEQNEEMEKRGCLDFFGEGMDKVNE